MVEYVNAVKYVGTMITNDGFTISSANDLLSFY